MAAELTDEQIEAAAKVLARYSDTPWAMLPETSKMKARTVAGEIIRAALSTLPSATGAEDAEPAAFIHYRRTGFGTLREAVLTPTGQLLPDVTPLYARTKPNGAAGGGEVSHG